MKSSINSHTEEAFDPNQLGPDRSLKDLKRPKPIVSEYLTSLQEICDRNFDRETETFGPKGALQGLPELIHKCLEIDRASTQS